MVHQRRPRTRGRLLSRRMLHASHALCCAALRARANMPLHPRLTRFNIHRADHGQQYQRAGTWGRLKAEVTMARVCLQAYSSSCSCNGWGPYLALADQQASVRGRPSAVE